MIVHSFVITSSCIPIVLFRSYQIYRHRHRHRHQHHQHHHRPKIGYECIWTLFVYSRSHFSRSLSPSILSLYIHTATYNQVQTNTPIYTRFLLIVISPQIPIPLIVVSSQQRCFARSSATCCTVPWTCRPLVPEHHTTRDHAQLLQIRNCSHYVHLEDPRFLVNCEIAFH